VVLDDCGHYVAEEQPAQFAKILAWGWRVPFLLSLLLGPYAQSRVEETTSMQDLRSTPTRSPVIELIRTHPKEILLAAGATVVNGAVYYLIAVYVLSYATQSLGLPAARFWPES
jgi:MFS transporter, MHS family, shikimate and dehydroshikimate transport protein